MTIIGKEKPTYKVTVTVDTGPFGGVVSGSKQLTISK